MRNLEFRVWDSIDEEFLQKGKGLNFVTLGKYEIDSNNSDSDVIIEQFTGLTDKNGKKVFEGDILYYNDGSDDNKGEVIFDQSETMFKIAWRHDTYSGNGFRNDAEIIGNIHENPELLK